MPTNFFFFFFAAARTVSLHLLNSLSIYMCVCACACMLCMCVYAFVCMKLNGWMDGWIFIRVTEREGDAVTQYLTKNNNIK